MQQATTSTKLGEEPNPLDSTMLFFCEKCLDIFAHWYLRINDGESSLTTKPHHSIDDLLTSARKRCPLCRLFLDTLSTNDITKIRSTRGKEKSCVVYFNPDRKYNPKFDNETCTLVLDFDFDNKEKQVQLPSPHVDVVDAACMIIYLLGRSVANSSLSRFRPILSDVISLPYYGLRINLGQSKAMDRMVHTWRTRADKVLLFPDRRLQKAFNIGTSVAT